MNKKYFYFAVRTSKEIVDRTGRPTKRDVLVYGTQVFNTAEACDAAYAKYRIAHPGVFTTIWASSRKIVIDPVTHEFMAFEAEPKEVQTA